MSARITEAQVEAMTEVAIDGPGYVSFYPSLHDCRRLLEAALSTERGDAEGWKPIETAPPNEFQGKVLIVGGAWPEPTIVKNDGDWWRHRLKDESHKGIPTHWRPLPAAPLPKDTHHGR